MAEARDCREELYERLVLLMAGHEGPEDLRQRMYIVLADYEIIGRSMELAPLEEIDCLRNRVLLHGKGEKDRYAYLNAKALISIERYLNLRKDSNPYLFAGAVENYINSKSRGNHTGWWRNPELVHAENHLERETPANITRRIGKLAGINVQCNPHKFRRTCATLALKRGMPVEQVSMMLGHESIQTTQIYLDISESDLQYAHGKYVV